MYNIEGAHRLACLTVLAMCLALPDACSRQRSVPSYVGTCGVFFFVNRPVPDDVMAGQDKPKNRRRSPVFTHHNGGNRMAPNLNDGNAYVVATLSIEPI